MLSLSLTGRQGWSQAKRGRAVRGCGRELGPPTEPEEPSLLPARRNGLMGGVRGREVTGGEGNHSQPALPWSGELGA